ncbi:unnamed protein product [Dibothriocephalus latus]|uniref:Uncharacterized protein n=1 Tax=Dibothriocephalus latus TaxID=60516 RepID=A0A3P7PLY1_DIBLA|nr:unnamed protein product [Dibothriocephalus latus]
MRKNLGVDLDERVQPDDDDTPSTGDAEKSQPATDFQTESADESDQVSFYVLIYLSLRCINIFVSTELECVVATDLCLPYYNFIGA